MVFTAPHERANLDQAMEFRLVDYAKDKVLTSAEAGPALVDLQAEIRALPDEAPVVLDFRGVRAITVPFVEVFLRPVLGEWMAGMHDLHPLLVSNTEPDVRETLSVALKVTGLNVLHFGRGAADVLGGDQVLNETVAAAQQLGNEFTATELAGRLEVSVPAANNRLRSLWKCGAVSRRLVVPSGGGKEYEYRVPATPRRR